MPFTEFFRKKRQRVAVVRERDHQPSTVADGTHDRDVKGLCMSRLCLQGAQQKDEQVGKDTPTQLTYTHTGT